MLSAVPSINVTTYRYDTSASGVNSSETQLTPANVKTGAFGKLATTPLDGTVYAQPLVVQDVSIGNGVNTTSGAAGVHNVVFVATENDSVYAVDTATGAVLWKRSFLTVSAPTGDQNNPSNATAITSPSDADVGLPNSGEEWGLTSTPVVDAPLNLLYVVVRTKEIVNGVAHFVQRLHALEIDDGTDAVTPFTIGDTSGRYVNNTPIYVYGSGDGSVTDPYNNTGKPVVQFNAQRELQRCALSLVNGTVYVTWASNGDNGPYHGFVCSWDVSQVRTEGFILSGVLCTSPNDGEAGIWMGGGGLTFEPDGSAFYALTGNGSGGAPALGPDGLPTNANYNEALIKVVADPTSSATHQNANGWGMKVTSFFTPYNVVALDNADSDFGSGAPLLLPPSAGILGHPNLIAAGGKDGRIFILDRNNLGGYHATFDAALNSVKNPTTGISTPPNVIAGTLSTPTYFNGKLYDVAGYLGNFKSWTISSAAALVPSSNAPEKTFGSLPGGPTISSSGANNGIVWQMDLSGQVLHAYNAASLATELWASNDTPGDALGASVKFNEPTVANGEVFVGTQNSLVIFGLTPAASSAPKAPALTAAALSSSSVNLTWTDATTTPNTATGYAIQQSTDGKTFTTITTAVAGATAISVGGLSESTQYYFRIIGFNALGNSPYSNVATATTTSGGGTTQGVSPNAPSGLGAAPLSATSVYLTWTANATNESGYQLDRALDVNFTQGLITETLAAGLTSYTDTATGIGPGQTFYYRLRANNSAGASGNSNIASTTVPLVPPKPTDQEITGVTSSEIDMEWQDNAAHLADGYRILRAVDHGTFVQVVNLPPTSRPAPSMYTWDDTAVRPGHYYEYHIQAYNTSGNNDFAGVNATSITAPPTGLAASATTAAVNLSWNAVSGAVSYNVYRGTAAGGESTTPIATGVTATTFSDSGVTAGATYYYEVAAVNPNAAYAPPLPSQSALSTEASATVPTVSVTSALTNSASIGGAALGGSASTANGVYTLAGCGVDIWKASDQFEYDYANVVGDTTLVSRVSNIQFTHSWAKAGVMIRESTAANSLFADMVITPGGHLAFQYRTATGAPAQMVQAATPTFPPMYLKIVRSANLFSGFYSSDGVAWTQLGSAVSINMKTSATAGLAVSSLNPSRLCTATFDNVTLTNLSVSGSKPKTGSLSLAPLTLNNASGDSNSAKQADSVASLVLT